MIARIYTSKGIAGLVQKSKPILRYWKVAAMGSVLWSVAGPGVTAVDLADTPVPVALNSSKVQPNIMFTLDDSGSMQFEVMPDEAIKGNARYVFPRMSGNYGGSDYDNIVVGFKKDDLTVAQLRSSRINKAYYDPALRYRPWTKEDGSEWPQADPVKAFHNPKKTKESEKRWRNLTVNAKEKARWLTGSSVSNEKEEIFYPALYYRYSSGDVSKLASYVRVEILSDKGPYVGGEKRTDCQNPGQCTYEEEIQNFANWYSYYRSRILASRAGIGKAFSRLSGEVRVGFGAINRGSKKIDDVTSPGTVVLGVKKFTGEYRNDWFDTLYGHTIPNSGTPLRRALDDVGQYFMRKDEKGPWGPKPLYACRQSYNILMTDGYWTEGGDSSPRSTDRRDNFDNTDGPVIQSPTRYQYKAGAPYADKYSNTLADIAMFYWNRDLQPDLENIVPTNSKDPAFWQHLVNFTVGLGVSASSMTENGEWPDPTEKDKNKINDLEHAARNSRGDFFNASDPETFADSLTQALNDIAGRNNTFASNAVSNPNVSADDNVIYGTSYNPADWSGEVSAYALDPVTGNIGTTSKWDSGAREKLKARTGETTDTRNLATFRPDSGGVPFRWNSLSVSQQNGLEYTDANGEQMLNFLRGHRTQEGEAFRKREHILGDIVNAEGVVVRRANFNYEDLGYATFKAGVTNRAKTLYQGANDGMLHAFDASIDANGGKERWAYIPGMLLGKLKNLSKKVGFFHEYYVDGTPVQADVDFSYTSGMTTFPVDNPPATRNPDWRTILVGGLGKGGIGYYALDVTDPLADNENKVAEKVLWEFTDADMGYSYGRPVIAKTRAAGWVVLLTSGYNNVPASKGGELGRTTGTGKGYLYVVNPRNGELIKKLEMPVPADKESHDYQAKPSGFAQISGFVENTDIDNTMELVYGGDLHGDVWRIDLTGNAISTWSVSRFAHLSDAQSKPQPLTAAPETAYIRDGYAKRRMVYVGTGKYLGITDVEDAQVQSIYGLKDAGILARENEVGVAKTQTAVPAPMIDARHSNLIKQTLTLSEAENTRTASTHAVDLNSKNGWVVDLPLNKERANTDPQLAYGVLAVTTNVPDNSPCSIYGGSAWMNFLDYRTGGAIRLANGTHATASLLLGNTLASRPSVIVANAKPYIIGSKTDDSRFKLDLPPPSVSKRVSWREIIEQ